MLAVTAGLTFVILMFEWWSAARWRKAARGKGKQLTACQACCRELQDRVQRQASRLEQLVEELNRSEDERRRQMFEWVPQAYELQQLSVERMNGQQRGAEDRRAEELAVVESCAAASSRPRATSALAQPAGAQVATAVDRHAADTGNRDRVNGNSSDHASSHADNDHAASASTGNQMSARPDSDPDRQPTDDTDDVGQASEDVAQGDDLQSDEEQPRERRRIAHRLGQLGGKRRDRARSVYRGRKRQ
jgi:hypothetical protein